MGMKPEYYPRNYGPTRPRRTQPAVEQKREPIPAPPAWQPVAPVAQQMAASSPDMPPVRVARPAVAIDQQAARLGVVWAEILGAPRARRPWEAKGTEPFASRLKPSP
ncbi:MAG: hypothetical protein KGZ66_01740 [Selenomonadales bacterium]|nr:hypothetical protein [Selenomonadales bacterium]